MESQIKKHVEEDRLEAYCLNLLDGDELAGIEEHLLFCATCQDRLQAVERYAVAMRSAAMHIRTEEKEVPAVPGVWPRLRLPSHVPIPVWCGAAALVALLLVVVSLPVHEQPGAPVDVELQAVRGESTGTAIAGHALRLHLDNQGVRFLPAWSIEIVDSEGTRVWTGTGAWSDNVITAMVAKSFTAGTYYVRLLNDTPDPAREYQLVVQ